MGKSPRCLYENTISVFLQENNDFVFGTLCKNYHGDVPTTTREAWEEEIRILKQALSLRGDSNGRVIFEYDIPRLGKRLDVVLLLRGIVFCLEFKVGENSILEHDVDQVLDYALDLKNFHKFSEERVIVPVLIPTKNNGRTSVIQKSLYDDKVVNPLVTGECGLESLIEDVLKVYPDEKGVY